MTADFELHGRLAGVAGMIPDHEFDLTEHHISVASSRVAVRWRVAPDDSRESEEAVQTWFESYLLALSLSTGSAGYVEWTGRTLHRADGGTSIAAWMNTRFGYVRTHPEELDHYGDLAAVLRRWPDIAEAAERVRTAMDLLRRGLTIAAGEAYVAVEGLATSRRLADWCSFGDRLNQVATSLDGDAMAVLWASFQLYRHDPSQIGAARRVLTERNADPLDYGMCCWRAAEIVEAVADGRQRGLL